MNRRHFVQLAALTAAGAAALPGRAAAAGTTAAQTLPALPYDFAALEPHIDARTMMIHHGKHHAAYVAGLTAALEKVPDLAKHPLEHVMADLPAVADESVRTALRNHGGGHVNHSFFWPTLKKGSRPGGPVADAIVGKFGSFDKFKEEFSSAAALLFGSGWAWLVVSKGDLAITTTPNQDSPISQGKTPILGIDVWEHAYYLSYQNRRPDYIAAVFNVINWDKVNEHFKAARG
jgi:Fe-Mn family superoxide dismutase